MSFQKKISIDKTPEMNTGFGSNASDYGGRFLNPDGSPNIVISDIGTFEKISWYHTMLGLKNWQFLVLIISFFISINLLFALIYYVMGVEHLSGMLYTNDLEKFTEAFFFSCQTFTTVGYGRINPVGFAPSAVASFEALLGLLSFAIATGLFYGRFARPRAFLKFSDNAIIAPYKNMNALMFRVAPYKNTTLTDAEVKVSLGMSVEVNGKMENRFYQLQLEFKTVAALTLSWTIVHPINEESPFYDLTEDDFKKTQGEVLVYLKAFDDMFANTVTIRKSYTFQEVIAGVKFIPMFKRSSNNTKTVLHLDKLNVFMPAELNKKEMKS